MTGQANYRDPVRAPQGLYPCRDGAWLAISAGTDAEWAALCALLGRPDLAADPRYAGNLSRQAHHDEIDDIIRAWTGKSAALALEFTLQAAGIPVSMALPPGA